MDVLAQEGVIRLACFAGVLAVMAAWEFFAPRRDHAQPSARRWSNLALVVVNTLVTRWLAPVGVVGIALVAEERGWGLFNTAAVPWWLAVVASVVALDLVIYLQHVLFHAVPLFWRLHLVHHADLEVDVTTGVRFHTVEVLLSFAIKAAAVVCLGAPAAAVVAFEVLLNATSMFNHANVRLPAWLDRVLRLVVVTPDMHRVHHSTDVRETNSNFGFNLPWWDFLFGTYRAQPAEGHEQMTLGLAELRDEKQCAWLHRMLVLPLRRSTRKAEVSAVASAAPPRVPAGT